VRYLADTSAIVRILRRQADQRWYDASDRGLIALCEPVLVETLTGVGARQFGRIEHDLRVAFPWAPVRDDAWTLVTTIQKDIAAKAQHHGLSVADHLIVATAIRLKLVLLHEDAAFETVARIVPQLQQERITTGP
jgi:predicted nucleic acid-binding protein